MQMVYLKKMFIYFLGAIGSAGFTFLILPIVTMYLSPEEYGKTSMFYIMQSFFICIIFLGLDQAFSREFYENKNKKELFSTAIWGSVCFTTLVFIIIYFFFFNQLSFLLFESIECKQLTFLFSISLFFCIWERFGLLYLRMDNQVNLFAGFSVLMKALIFFFTLFLLNFSTKATFELVVLGHLLGQILGVVCLMIWLIGKYSLVLLFVNFKLLKRLLKFGLPVVFGTVIYCFILNIDKILLKNLSDFEQLGLYMIAFKIASVFLLFQVAFSNFWIPISYRWYKESKPISYFKRANELTMFFLSSFFMLFLMLKDSIILLLPESYGEIHLIVPFICFYPMMMLLSETTTLGIVFSKKSYLNIYVSLIALATTTISGYFLVRLFGAQGAALAVAIGFITFYLARTYFSMCVWQGFSIKKQLLIIFLLVVGAIINSITTQNGYILVSNISLLLVLLFIQRNMVNHLKKYLKKKERLFL